MTPAAPETTIKSHVLRTTCPVSIPVVSARSKLSASARIWRPSEVTRSIVATAVRTTNDDCNWISSVSPMLRPRNEIDDVTSASSERGSVPQMNWIT